MLSPEISAGQWGETGCTLMVLGCSYDLGTDVVSPQCPAERSGLQKRSVLCHDDEHGLVFGFCFRTMIIDGIPEIMMRKIDFSTVLELLMMVWTP